MSTTQKEQALKAMRAAMKELKNYNSSAYSDASEAEVLLRQAITSLEGRKKQ